MRRDTAEGKINWLLVRPGPMLRRWAALMTRGSVKYESDREPGELRNWQKAEGLAEYERFLESFARHAEQYLTNSLRWLQGLAPVADGTGDDGNPFFEDHGAACFFNLNGAEYVRERLEANIDEWVAALDEPQPEPETIWPMRFPDGFPDGWCVEYDAAQGWTFRKYHDDEKPSRVVCAAPGYALAPACGGCEAAGECALRGIVRTPCCTPADDDPGDCTEYRACGRGCCG